MAVPGLDDRIRWVSVFADVPADRLAAARAFWSAATGTTPGPAAGDSGEYLPLDPGRGDRYLWVQRVGRDDPGWHLDLHVPDVDEAASFAEHLGAALDRRADGLAVLHTPGGLPFCLVAEEAGRERRRPDAPPRPGGRSLADQLCLDIPADRFEQEVHFWASLTGWPRLGRQESPEFARIAVPERLPVQLLLQRLGPDDGEGIRAHVDLSADDRDAEVERHVALGARILRRTENWSTLIDPAGLVYCVTCRPTGVRYT